MESSVRLQPSEKQRPGQTEAALRGRSTRFPAQVKREITQVKHRAKSDQQSAQEPHSVSAEEQMLEPGDVCWGTVVVQGTGEGTEAGKMMI